ncbi:uncharacterized protein [Salminus brasiliensis]|uniref:uncharacterized protein isoform X2 n=1 Tax=Salminus brasiliensis TaxID=930266 RepID=UPI003B82F609
MESVHRERCEDGGSRLGASTVQRHVSASQLLQLSPSLCSNSPLRKISDETFPYMSGIFDDTIDPSFSSDLPDRSQIKTLAKGQADVISGLRSQNKAAYNSWLSAPVENCPSIDFSMSITSPPDDSVSDVTETCPVEGMLDASSHFPESDNCARKCDARAGSKNSTFNMTKDLKEKSGLNAIADFKEGSGLNATADFKERSGLNATADLKERSGLNATADLKESPGLNATADLKESPGLNATADLKESPGLNATADLKERSGLNATADLKERSGLNATADFKERSGLNATADFKERSGLNLSADFKGSRGLNATTELKESPGWNIAADLKESPGLNATTDLKERSGLNATIDLKESPGLNATTDLKERSGLNATTDLKERSGLNSTLSDPSVRTECNSTFEKTPEQRETSTPGSSSSVSTVNCSLEAAHEKHLNSTVDVCGPSSTTTGQPNEKLDHSVDIRQPRSSIPEQQCSEGLPSVENCEKHSTFTKATEVTVDVEQNASASLHVSPEAGEPSSANPQPVGKTFTKHNVTTEVTSAEPLSNLKNANVNTTVNITKPFDSYLRTHTDADAGVAVDHTPSPEPSEQLCVSAVPDVVALSAEAAVCSNRTLDLPEAEGKGEEHQERRRRKNGFFEQDSCLSLDISHSSIFSLDDPLEITRSRVLVTSTPIVLGRGFDRLRCAKPMDMQKRLSVINSIDAHSNNDLAGVSGSDTTGANPSSVKSETCSEAPKDSAKCTTSKSLSSESAVVNKPPSKLAVRRKIPQPACKSSIPKTQIPARPPTSQGTSMVKSKTVPAAQAVSQLEASSSALHGVKRPVQLNKGKKLAPPKNITTAKNIKTLYTATSTSGCALTTGSKASQTITQAKPSELQPPGRLRFGPKPPGIAVFSAEAGHPQTNNKPTGLSDVQDQLSGAEPPGCSKPDEGAQSRVTASKDIKSKKASHDCKVCTLLKEKINTFHQELEGFLQELGKRPAGCNWLADWLPFQPKFEMCLEECKRLQAEHQ